MLHILLCILKWIGIILLSILALILLILFAVLFVPLRYKAKGRYEEKPDVAVTVSWLLHLVHVKVQYTDALFWQVRILGIPFLDSRRKKKQKEPEIKSETATEEDAENRLDETDDGTAGIQASAVTEESQGTEADMDAEEVFETRENTKVSEEDADDDADSEETRKGFWAKVSEFVRAIFRTIAQVFHNIRYTIQNICDKIKNVRENIGYYHSVITSDEGRKTVAMVKRELGNLFKHIAPKKFRLSLRFGFDDPSTTGQVMGIAGMLYPIWNYDITLQPDFEQKVVAGQLYIRGRIRVFTVIRIAWRVYFNKNLKKVLAMLKKGGANHG